jgi:putative sterol carrier protein
MALFGTQEWQDDFCAALNKDAPYIEAAKDFEGDMICIVLPEEGVSERSLTLYFDPYHGKIRHWDLLASPMERRADYVLSGKYSVWKKICQGELDMLRAVMFRQLKVEGKIMNLMKQTKASRAMMRVMTGLNTIFQDDL